MTDQSKAALDAFNRLAEDVVPYDRHPDIVKQDVDIVRAYITTQPAPTVTDDELNKALQIADSRNEEVKELDFGNVFWACCILANYIRAATQPQPTDAPCRTCKGDPETCADVPDARRVYGFHNGKALSCHPLGVESAIETFLRFNGAVFVDGKPVEKFGITTGAMSSAIQAYLDYYRNGVGDTNETSGKEG